MTKKENYFKLFSGIVGILLFLVLLETILQIYSYAFLKPNVYKLKKNPNEKIIMAFGESTTETRYYNGRSISWPEQLEVMLNDTNNDKHLKFKILNFGKSATRSMFIKEKIFQMVEKYSPDAVVLMMGTNDNKSLEFLNPDKFWQKAKLVKIYQWIVHSLYIPRLPSNSNMRMIYHSMENFDVTLPDDEMMKQVEEIKRNIDAKEHWFLYREMSAKIFLKSLSVDNQNYPRKEVTKYLKRASKFCYLAFDNKNYDQKILSLIAMTADPNDAASKELALKIIIEALDKKIEIDKVTLSMMISSYSQYKDYNKLLERTGFVTRESQPIYDLKKNFQEIARFLKSKNVKLYVMSYPTTKIDIYKSMFDPHFNYDSGTMSSFFYSSLPNVKISKEFQDVRFISNENFNLVNDLYKEGYIFKDLFATWLGGKFGHTTEYGHYLIAKNVFDEFQKEIIVEVKK